MSPATLPTQLLALVTELAAQHLEQGGLTEAEQEKLAEVYVDFAAWCAELASSAIPMSVQHDDLHSSNVCWGGSVVRSRLIDWGDATWGFPLATMLGTVNSIAWHAGCERDDPRVLAARDAYLEAFAAYSDRAGLVRYVDLARRTGCVTKALSYRAALMDEPVETHRDEDFPVRGWLLELLEVPAGS